MIQAPDPCSWHDVSLHTADTIVLLKRHWMYDLLGRRKWYLTTLQRMQVQKNILIYIIETIETARRQERQKILKLYLCVGHHKGCMFHKVKDSPE